MSEKYGHIMDRIKVTDEMHSRIMHGVRTAAVEKPKPLLFAKARRYIAAAACLAVIIAGALTLYGIINKEWEQPPLLTAPGSDEYSSAFELSSALGFEVRDAEKLPFVPDEVIYTAIINEIAEITYIGSGQTAVLRISQGSEDNSGDYNEYPQVKQAEINSLKITLKGGPDGFSLAVWEEGGLSYSLGLSVPADEQELLAAAESVK